MDAEGLFVVWGTSRTATLMILCDAFFVPGILLTMFGALMWIATTGFFDSLGYAFRTAAHLFIPFKGGERKSFYDYKEERAEKRGGVPYFILFVGMFYLAISMILLALYYVA